MASTVPSRSLPSGQLSNQQKERVLTPTVPTPQRQSIFGAAHTIDHNKSIFLEERLFEDLVALRFNPVGPVAQFHSVARGMSMLACRLLTAVEAKYCQEYEEAAADTKHTCSLKDLLKRNHGKTVAPAANYMDLKLIIGMYCGLLWTIFGDHCNYCKELLKIYHILDRKECFTIRNVYTREVCTWILWAIISEECSFFGRNPVALDFAPGATCVFSTCLLEGITDSVRNAIPIQRVMFPCKWMVPPNEGCGSTVWQATTGATPK